MLRALVISGWMLTAFLLALSARLLAEPIVREPTDSTARMRSQQQAEPSTMPDYDLDRIVTRDLFDAMPRAGDVPPPQTAPQMVPAPRHTLVARGIAWSNRPLAIIEGIPGTAGGQPFALGDSVGSFVITGITRRSVRLRSSDTSFTLTLPDR